MEKQGDRCRFGAKNLRKLELSEAEILHVISNGRNRMPSWKSTLTQNQILEIIAYIKTFKS